MGMHPCVEYDPTTENNDIHVASLINGSGSVTVNAIYLEGNDLQPFESVD